MEATLAPEASLSHSGAQPAARTTTLSSGLAAAINTPLPGAHQGALPSVLAAAFSPPQDGEDLPPKADIKTITPSSHTPSLAEASASPYAITGRIALPQGVRAIDVPAANPARAAPPLNFPSDDKQLAGCSDSWPPYMSLTHKTSLTGPAIEAIIGVVEHAGYKITVHHMPQARCNALVERGLMHMRFGLREEPNIVATDITIAPWLLAAVVHEGDAFTAFTSLSEMEGMNVIVPDDYLYPDDFQAWLRDHVRTITANYGNDTPSEQTALLQLVVAGRARILFEDQVWANSVIQSERLPLRLLSPAVAAYPVDILVSPQFPQLAEDLKTAFKTLPAGFIDAIYLDAFQCSLKDIMAKRTCPALERYEDTALTP